MLPLPQLARTQRSEAIPVKKLNVAVIGVGAMGKRHAENLRGSNIPEARLVAIADSSRERVEQVGDELEVEHRCVNYADVLERKDVDAVVLTTPNKLHAQNIEEAAKAGKHIFCEKPMALTLAQADSALAAVRKAGVQLQLGFMRRYDPGYKGAKQRILDGEIGTPMIFKSVGRDRQPPNLSFYQGGTNGTLFITTCVHDFDLARWILEDEVIAVHAFGGAVMVPEFAQMNDVDAALVNLKFSRGGLGNIEALRKSSYGYDVRSEILGTQGALFVGSLHSTPLQTLSGAGMAQDVMVHWLRRFTDAYLTEMQDFVHTILSDQPVPITGEDGRRALVISVAAERSYREGRPIAISEVSDGVAASGA